MSSVWRGELDAVALCERTFGFAIKHHSLQAARIVAHLLTALLFDSQHIFLRVHSLDAGVFSRVDPMCFASLRVTHDISPCVLLSPLPVRAGDLLAGHKNSQPALPLVQSP